MLRVCFVCLGNICRSPTAECVFRHLVSQAGLSHWICAESAGTAAHHVGQPADRRSIRAAARRGIVLEGVARQFVASDWERFDLVLAMDSSTLAALQASASAAAGRRLHLLMSFDSDAPVGAEVPDPYYGGGEGFERVLDLCEGACRGLFKHLCQQHPPPRG